MTLYARFSFANILFISTRKNSLSFSCSQNRAQKDIVVEVDELKKVTGFGATHNPAPSEKYDPSKISF